LPVTAAATTIGPTAVTIPRLEAFGRVMVTVCVALSVLMQEL
jgi:hypothetical protein